MKKYGYCFGPGSNYMLERADLKLLSSKPKLGYTRLGNFSIILYRITRDGMCFGWTFNERSP